MFVYRADRTTLLYLSCHLCVVSLDSRYVCLSLFLSVHISTFADVCLVINTLSGMALPPLCDFIKQRTQNRRHTRSASRGDCIISHRSSSFSKSAFSVIQHTLGMLCHHTYAQKTENIQTQPQGMACCQSGMQTLMYCLLICVCRIDVCYSLSSIYARNKRQINKVVWYVLAKTNVTNALWSFHPPH